MELWAEKNNIQSNVAIQMWGLWFKQLFVLLWVPGKIVLGGLSKLEAMATNSLS